MMREKEIRQLISLLEENENIGEIEMSTGPFGFKKLRVSRQGAGGSSTVIAAAPAPAATPTGPAVSTPVAQMDDGLHTIKAPMVGTFFRAPNPESDPFVSEGSKITPGSALCIIEAMKLMNEIEADVTGTIREILVENGQAVEYGQPLFKVEKL
jgi:acetyl-CoA carboxylase biotin carboxyl carrier protein